MLTRKSKYLFTKILSFFSVIRGHNILVIIVAQYLASIFILSPNINALNIIFDFQLFILVIASSLAIASGYIINNFYDAKKDLINRPTKVMIDRLVSQQTKLKVYFSINFIVVLISSFVSWRAMLYFSIYIFSIWFYSHKLKKYPIIGNITASILAILPFFAILLYYKHFYHVIIAHASFLYLLILIRELIKDLENIQGDLLTNYSTIPVLYGEKIAKFIISILVVSTIIPVFFLVDVYEVGYMDIYFYISTMVLVFFLIRLWDSSTKTDYLNLHFLLKVIIILGVFCIVLIKPTALFH